MLHRVSLTDCKKKQILQPEDSKYQRRHLGIEWRKVKALRELQRWDLRIGIAAAAGLIQS